MERDGPRHGTRGVGVQGVVIRIPRAPSTVRRCPSLPPPLLPLLPPLPAGRPSGVPVGRHDTILHSTRLRSRLCASGYTTLQSTAVGRFTHKCCAAYIVRVRVGYIQKRACLLYTSVHYTTRSSQSAPPCPCRWCLSSLHCPTVLSCHAMLSIKVLSPPEVFTNPSRNFLCSLEGRNNGCALRPTGTVQSRPAPWAFFLFLFLLICFSFPSFFF